MKKTLLIAYHILMCLLALGQMKNEYSFGIDNKGNYTMQLNRFNENKLLSFTYANYSIAGLLNTEQKFMPSSHLPSTLSVAGLSYFNQKSLKDNFTIYYGGGIQSTINPTRNESIKAAQNFFSNIELILGTTYKLTENITIGAEFRHGYGNFLLNSAPLHNLNSPFHSLWLHR